MSEPFDIQLAIQGGGAKLSALMATLEAVEKLQEEKILRVTRIAGTSAGSIVGCMFAAGVRMDTLRILLRGDLGKRLVRYFTMPGLIGIGLKVRKNEPFWDERKLAKELAAIFLDAKVSQISDLKEKTGIEVLVIAANVGDAKKVVHRGGDSIVSAIMNSCGLPYCFRVWNTSGNPVIVDGGICENLPSDDLVEGETQHGPVVAVSFVRPTSNAPRTLKEFSMALLDTAMNNSITRARSALPQGRICQVETSIETFDFKRGLTEGLDTEYKLVKLQAEQWFRDFIARESKPDSSTDPWVEENATVTEIMGKLGQVYRDQHANSKFEHMAFSFTVQANCLLSEDDPNFGRPDLMKYSVKFKPSNEAIYCMSISLGDARDTQYLRRHRWDVWDDNGNAVNYISVPVRDPEFPTERKQLIFFVPQLQPNSGPYELLFQDEAVGFMKPLAVTKQDQLGICPSRVLGSVGRIDLVLYVPEQLASAKLSPKAGVPFPGREMTSAERKQFPPPPEFRTLGWTGENLSVSECFAVDVCL